VGKFFYLYAILDLWSRKIVAWEVHDRESGEWAAELVEKAVWREHLRAGRECKDFCVCELYVTLEGGSDVWLRTPMRSSLN
jgi:transposase InsO family protein